ncbi:MAG: hypothetical protein HPY45_14015 [Anaerolineae bacterium]|nr:hypothetical protein [Anaerolineae bacterium]
MANPRKRFSAFEDFPDATKIGESKPVEGILSTQTKPVETAAVERIERLKPSQMMPDRFQPRHLLPASIRSAFFTGKIDCYEAARRWIQTARQDMGYQTEIDRLVAMGDSFEEHGQIKPITGSWVAAQQGQFIFLIETGERRFWAACLRRVIQNLEEEPLLRVEVVAKPSRQRQVLENRHAEPPSAVGQACEIAALILAEMGIHPDETTADTFDYFRLARAQRMPAGLWEQITPIMQLTRPRMVQLLNVLQLPTPLLELADRYRLPERVLREVLSMPREQWERMLHISIQQNLTSSDVAELGETLKPQEKQSATTTTRSSQPRFPGKTAISGLRRFANALMALDEFAQAQALDEVADELVSTGEADGMSFLLGELAHLLDARLSRR